MTFYEAALRVLESEGHPLHFLEITEKSIAQNLLSHVGKMPEQTMLSRLAAMAKRTRDRRVIVTAKDTFALPEWGLPEDAAALAETGLPEENEEENLPPLRPTERHPEPRADLVRSAGRGERHKKRGDRQEEERSDRSERGSKRKRYPPIAEVAFEVLSDSAAEAGLAPTALLELARTRELVSDELSSQVLLMALIEDNQRRIDAGRKPQFRYSEESPVIALEHEPTEGAPGQPTQDLQLAFAKALGVPVENGRPALRSRPSSVASVGAAPVATSEEVADLFSTARSAVREARRASAKTLRQKLSDLELGTLERACVKMLHGLSFRELKVAKRSKDGPLLTGRRKEGSVELRWVIRVWRAGAPLDRRTVQDLRRDVGHFSANIGLLLSPQDVRSEARSEAQGAGALAFLWCGDALAEKFMEAHTGVKTVSLEMFEPDESFFVDAERDAEEARLRREDRQRERDARPSDARPSSGRPSDSRSAGDSRPERVVAEASDDTERTPRPEMDADAGPASDDEGDDDEGPEEGDESPEGGASAGPAGEGGAEGAKGEGGRRRRRRRRGRRGRGPRPEGAPGAAGAAPGSPPAPPSGDSGGGGGSEPSA